ncbi:MAG: glutathione S-transferase family protein [Sphingomonadaceae bacterium]|nr:glutathione S-transferase family protein [Sphingomonadaceae bacterium]
MLLYHHPLSANGHKVKLLLGFLSVSHDEKTVDVPGGEQFADWFGVISDLRQIPVLDDGAVRIRDAQAILIYLGAKYDPERRWWPTDAAEQGIIAQWLSFAAVELQNGINLSRLYFRLSAPCDIAAAQMQGEKTLGVLDRHLANKDWLELGRPTIADLACVTFAARSGEAKHDITAYPNVSAWVERVRTLPNFTGMEGFA